jgi:hypothetical protein
MRNRHRHHTHHVVGLRLTIDCLPVATREAMLRGVRANERIIVGAYVDDEGGVCPMLAAHRSGGRTDFLAFAKAWDRFTRVKGTSRQATARELRVLIGHLEASLEADEHVQLDRAIGEHVALCERTRGERAGEPADARDPRGHIVARRLRAMRRAEQRVRPQSASPGRTNIISGMTHAGDNLMR